MTPREIRIELLRQHAELRGRIAEVRRLVSVVRIAGRFRNELKDAVLQLTDALGAHNNREEELLRRAAPDETSVVGHLELMNKRHFAEHKALHAALLEVRFDPDHVRIAQSITEALDHVVGHMDSEEKTFACVDMSSEEDTKPR